MMDQTKKEMIMMKRTMRKRITKRKKSVLKIIRCKLIEKTMRKKKKNLKMKKLSSMSSRWKMNRILDL